MSEPWLSGLHISQVPCDGLEAMVGLEVSQLGMEALAMEKECFKCTSLLECFFTPLIFSYISLLHFTSIISSCLFLFCF